MVKTSSCCLVAQKMLNRCLFNYQRGDMHLLSKRKLILLSPKYLGLRKFMFMHHTISSISLSCILVSYFALMHIGSSEGITLLEFEAEEEQNQEAPQQVALESEEQAPEELPECPDHRPTSFLKGKPRSILSLLCFYKYYLSPLCLMHQVKELIRTT